MTRAFILAATILWCANPAEAQTPAQAPAGGGVSFLTRAAFHMTAEHLSGIDDERFRWDTNFGGDLDLMDYTLGRLTFAGNYQAILGEELWAFDPNQGNYMLEGALSARLRQIEGSLVFHHVSRHLSDREKDEPVDWNMLGGRANYGFLAGSTYVEARGDLRWTVQRSYVDYVWEVDSNVRADYLVKPGVGLLASGGFRYLGVDDTRERDNQVGYRAEGGVRLEGRGAAVELFIAGERRIDPYPLEFGTATWFSAGFRLLSR